MGSQLGLVSTNRAAGLQIRMNSAVTSAREMAAK